MMLSEKVIEKEEANFQRKHPQLDRSNPWKPQADFLFNDEGLSSFYPGRK